MLYFFMCILQGFLEAILIVKDTRNQDRWNWIILKGSYMNAIKDPIMYQDFVISLIDE